MCGCPPDCRCGCLSCPCDLDWFEAYPVKCRHCGAEIALYGDTWCERQTGFTACVKGQIRPTRAPGENPFTAPVLHEPMPAGLDGSVAEG
jgi:hypothetical protein